MINLHTIIVVVQVLSALTIIGLVLVQHGKGADMGAAFGSGASGSLFGASGSSNFLSKATGVAAAIFFAATLGLAFTGNRSASSGNGGVMENVPVSSVPGAAPAPATSTAPAPAAPNPADKSNQIPK
jgi:preprotein translocase subunit SecG